MSKYLEPKELLALQEKYAMKEPSDQSIWYEQQIANAAADHALKDLKCGAKSPCEGCEQEAQQSMGDCSCEIRAKWEGQVEGYALAESKVSAARAEMAREIVEYWRDYFNLPMLDFEAKYKVNVTTSSDELEPFQEYLKEKGIGG